jgi:hypothetical protein
MTYLKIKLNTLNKDIIVGGKLHLPKRNTLEEDCFVALQSYSPQSETSGVLKLGGNNSFLISKEY